MLMPLPAHLRALVSAYEALRAQELRDGSDTPSPRLRDLAYTLCVSTGTRDITQALEAAHAYLATASSRPKPVPVPEGARPAARVPTEEACAGPASS
ncbi:DUF5133 domain-containing protein [Streptomyces sp. NPDC003635]